MKRGSSTSRFPRITLSQSPPTPSASSGWGFPWEFRLHSAAGPLCERIVDSGDGFRRWIQEMDSGDGSRRWIQEMDPGDGFRRWIQEMDSGDCRRQPPLPRGIVFDLGAYGARPTLPDPVHVVRPDRFCPRPIPPRPIPPLLIKSSRPLLTTHYPMR